MKTENVTKKLLEFGAGSNVNENNKALSKTSDGNITRDKQATSSL